MASRFRADGNLRLALRAYYLANLAWLGAAGFLTIHAGRTKSEYESELRRKTRAVSEARDLFAANVAAFERVWYGLRDVTQQDADEFRSRLERMRAVLAAPKEAAA